MLYGRAHPRQFIPRYVYISYKKEIKLSIPLAHFVY